MSRLATKHLTPLSLGLALCLGLGLAPLQAAEKLHPSVERMQKDINYLAGDECEGRGVETAGINKAADYIVAEFKSLNLKTPGKTGSYFQPFTIPSSSKLSSPNLLVLEGPEGKKLEPAIEKAFKVSAFAPTAKASAGLVFVGYGITIGEKEYDDYRGIDVAGKIVVVLRQTPRINDEKEPFYPNQKQVASLISKIQNAESHKAAGLIFVNDRDKAGKTDELMPFEYSRGQGTAKFPVIHLSREVVGELLAGTGKKLADIEVAIDKDLKPQSIELKGWKATLETTVERVVINAKNIIGVLEGAGPLAEETVIIGAHYDHLGRGEVGSREKGSKAVHYGADDNGSGTTSVLELARRFAAMKDRQGRRLVFMLFSGEERGLLGSAYYCKQPIYPLKDTVAMLNLDMVGRLRPDDDTKKDKLEIGGVGSAKSFEKLIDDVNVKYDFRLTKTKSGTGPSDHASFYVNGVPVFFFFTGFHPEYHKPSDKPNLINVAGMKKVCDMVEDLALKISTEKDRPEYVKGVIGKSPAGTDGPRLGIIPAQYDEDETKGLPVGEVIPGGAADKGGMKKNDWIIEIAGQPVKNIQGYMKAMSAAKKGQEMELKVLRGEEKLKLKVTPQ